MKFGLALCSRTMDDSTENNGLFFTSITQINHGGPDIVHDNDQKGVIAGLNLKAGRLSIILSDYATAFTFFQQGITYLAEDCWTTQYELSLNLYDAVAETASSLTNIDAVKLYTDTLVEHARTFDDSLHCKYTV